MLKEKLRIKIKSLPVFLDITKVAYFRWKNADVSWTQEVCHVIHMFFGCYLGKALKISQESTCVRVSFLTKKPMHRCFAVNFVKFLKNTFLTEHFRATASVKISHIWLLPIGIKPDY